ncbi:cytochrome c-type biogenesis protein [Shewanella sp. Isolate8]|uniref:cytochrome c-type biogenesis protein n=1 Tax=Shewanella sp. Isolate8 TaxID=2908529 RepID=UPI001EFCF93F|nr:cytochrome c-type biogenesis protein [Shewanella sp. Isolate8]MCG9748033.1 cytochrome c-type biogenesis protein CcmH [Shewanella sp. Isolate8]
MMTSIKRLLLLGATLTLLLGQAQAEVQTNTSLQAPAVLKRQAIEIAATLRCPMSTNQNLLDSQSPIASELKAEIYLQLERGKTADEIVDFMVARYGERIRYMPSLTSGTALLFFIPLGLLAAVLFWYLRQMHTRRPLPHSQEHRS